MAEERRANEFKSTNKADAHKEAIGIKEKTLETVLEQKERAREKQMFSIKYSTV